MQGLRLTVQDLDFSIPSSGCRVLGSGFEVSDYSSADPEAASGCRVQGSGFRV